MVPGVFNMNGGLGILGKTMGSFGPAPVQKKVCSQLFSDVFAGDVSFKLSTDVVFTHHFLDHFLGETTVFIYVRLP